MEKIIKINEKYYTKDGLIILVREELSNDNFLVETFIEECIHDGLYGEIEYYENIPSGRLIVLSKKNILLTPPTEAYCEGLNILKNQIKEIKKEKQNIIKEISSLKEEKTNAQKELEKCPQLKGALDLFYNKIKYIVSFGNKDVFKILIGDLTDSNEKGSSFFSKINCASLHMEPYTKKLIWDFSLKGKSKTSYDYDRYYDCILCESKEEVISLVNEKLIEFDEEEVPINTEQLKKAEEFGCKIPEGFSLREKDKILKDKRDKIKKYLRELESAKENYEKALKEYDD